MFDRISNSWELVKASAAVLAADKELLIFPVVSSIGVLIVTLTFAVPTFMAGLFDSVAAGDREILGFVVVFLFYVAQYTVIFFANSALVGAAMIRLRGGDPTVGDGFRVAFDHIGDIVGYALIAATVGMVLRTLSERGGTLGRIGASLVGLAWNIATYLTVPVLIAEDVGPMEAVRRSVALLKRTWGEQIVGNFSIGLIFGLLTVATIVLGIGGVVLGIMAESIAIAVLAAGIMIFLLLGLGLINGALSGIYAAALYRYAITGEASQYFPPELVERAFRAE